MVKDATLRAARADDAPAVAALLVASRRAHLPFLPEVHPPDDVQRWVAQTLLRARPQGGGVTLAADHTGRLLGVVATAVEPAGAEPAPPVAESGRSTAAALPVDSGLRCGWVEQLYLAPGATGAGLGTRLLAHALAALAAHGCPVRLWCFAQNHGARRFYERAGFAPVRWGDGSGNEEGQPDVLYERFAAPGPRVWLRRFLPVDAPRFRAYRGDADVGRYQGFRPLLPQQALEFVMLMHAAPVLQTGEWFQLAIATRGAGGGLGIDSNDDEDTAPGRAEAGVLVGDIGLLRHDAATVEIGFTLAPAAQHQGLAQEAVRQALDWLATVPGLHRARATSDARNAASIKLLQRLGFVHTATRQAVFDGQACVEWDFDRRLPVADRQSGDRAPGR